MGEKARNCELAGMALMLSAVVGVIGALSPSSGGVVGGFLGRTLAGLAGEGRFVVPLFLAWAGVVVIRRQGAGRLCGALVLFAVGLTLFHLMLRVPLELGAAMAGDGGGLVAVVLGYVLFKAFGFPGAYVILCAVALLGLALVTGLSLTELISHAALGCRDAVRRTGRGLVNFVYVEVPEGPPVVERAETIEKAESREEPLAPERPRRPRRHPEVAAQLLPPPRSDAVTEYELPPLHLLSRPPRKQVRSARDETENARLLEETLESFGVKARVIQVSRGPAVTRYEVQPAAGVKVSRIVSLADDIALSMAAPGVRIEAPVPGKAVVGIEVPNKEISMVHLRDLLESREFTQATSPLTVALGKDIAGNPVVADLARMPHLLIAGATGSGKSVCLNTLIASILFRARPDQVKFLLIDPKMVELATYNGIPHLVAPVVTDPKKAAVALRWAVREMEHRYALFAGAGVRDIYRFNRWRLANPGQGPPLPLIVIVIDELADLMMVAPAEVEDAVCRLAQMARAAGIHLVVATQRPSVDVITGLIKANIPSRLSFAVSSQIDSRTILDMGGAEKLLGKGDMLFLPVGAQKPIRVQGAYLADREVENLVAFLRRQAEPVYDEGIWREETAEQEEAVADDELLPKAVKILIESGHASISLLQRRLRIGYARAARLIDIMERRGLVGGYEGSKPRPVLITMEQYHQLFKENPR